LCSEIQELIHCIWNKEELPQEWNEYNVLPIYKKDYKVFCNNCRGISLLPTAYRILCNIILARLTPMSVKLLGIISVGSIVIDLPSINFLHSPDTREKMGVQWYSVSSAIYRLE
jgi:hypothetical protein